MSQAKELFKRRKRRTRFKLASVTVDRPRLTVFRSKQHMYVQIINDQDRRTMVSASTLDKDLKTKLKATSNKAAAEEVGKLVAQRAVKAGIKQVVFDRGGYLYHGRVKALADAAREGGLSF
ncbi:MAG TPA: 50S ribosomal protein L18 [Alphaproteobacteria bacterium]|nr:50S ribosomal protein L18 [Alphaproteobacteria bacterium]